MRWLLFTGLILAGCHTVAPAQGPVSTQTMPQAQEQCKAQPWLAWCKNAGK